MKGRVAVVTGAASGIGFAIAKAMSDAGAGVVLADVSDRAGETALANLRESGGKAEFVPGDISKSGDVRRSMDVAFKEFGRIDILVNNAGLQHIAPVVDFPEERWDYLIGVILTGTFLCCKYAVPHMIRQKWGRVINLASLHGKVASPFKAAYVAAKHGVLGLTKVLALEVAEHNITSNAICPAYVRTPLVEKQIDEQARRHGISREDVVQKIMLEPAAIRRLLDPEEVAALAVYLCSDQAAGMTGSAIDIDLGWTAR
ncbi:MAG: 3-hydroxybutyrate dehydrogenase [Candidatus Acidiferrales bacterium]